MKKYFLILFIASQSLNAQVFDMADDVRKKAKEEINNDDGFLTGSEKKIMNGAIDVNQAAFDHVETGISKDNSLSKNEKNILGIGSSSHDKRSNGNTIQAGSLLNDAQSVAGGAKNYLEARKQMKAIKENKKQEK